MARGAYWSSAEDALLLIAIEYFTSNHLNRVEFKVVAELFNELLPELDPHIVGHLTRRDAGSMSDKTICSGRYSLLIHSQIRRSEARAKAVAVVANLREKGWIISFEPGKDLFPSFEDNEGLSEYKLYRLKWPNAKTPGATVDAVLHLMNRDRAWLSKWREQHPAFGEGKVPRTGEERQRKLLGPSLYPREMIQERYQAQQRSLQNTDPERSLAARPEELDVTVFANLDASSFTQPEEFNAAPLRNSNSFFYGQPTEFNAAPLIHPEASLAAQLEEHDDTTFANLKASSFEQPAKVNTVPSINSETSASPQVQEFDVEPFIYPELSLAAQLLEAVDCPPISDEYKAYLEEPLNMEGFM